MNLMLKWQLIPELAIWAAAFLVLFIPSRFVLRPMCSSGFSSSCSTAHHEHLNVPLGTFHVQEQKVWVQGRNAEKEEIWKILNASATTSFKMGSVTFFHPPDTSWKVQKFTSHILLVLPGICHLARTFRASLYLFKFSRLAYFFVHFAYHPHSKQETYNKKIYLPGSQEKCGFEMLMCRNNKNN